jgi:hypothetical protein
MLQAHQLNLATVSVFQLGSEKAYVQPPVTAFPATLSSLVLRRSHTQYLLLCCDHPESYVYAVLEFELQAGTLPFEPLYQLKVLIFTFESVFEHEVRRDNEMRTEELETLFPGLPPTSPPGSTLAPQPLLLDLTPQLRLSAMPVRTLGLGMGLGVRVKVWYNHLG